MSNDTINVLQLIKEKKQKEDRRHQAAIHHLVKTSK
jgi:hypothetical protein